MKNVSRRSFVELTVGSIMSLPVLAGGLIAAPTTALATGETAESETEVRNYAIIDVVTPWEVGIVLRDVTRVVTNGTGDETNDAIQGIAHVTVTSRANGKSVSGDTNADGIVNLNIKALAEDPDGVGTDNLTAWNFNGTIKVTCDGYRPFETALMRVMGGGGLIVPMHPGNSSGPYPYRVSFEGWDALYTKNEFLLASGNTDNQTIEVVTGVSTSRSPVTVQLWVDGDNTPRQSTTATIDSSSKLATATFKAPFLKKGDANQLPKDGKVRIVMKQSGMAYSWPMSLKLDDAVIDAPTDQKGITLKPFNTKNSDQSRVKSVWPGDAPLVGGGDLSFWTPQLPIDVYINPFGYIQLTLKTPSWGYKSDNGGENPGKWGSFPKKSVSEQFNKMVKTAQSMSDKTSSALSKPGGFQQIDCFRAFSFLMNFQLMAAAQWDSDKGLFQGIVGGQFLAAVNFTITENFFAGPIPVLITFALDASFIASLNAACYSTKKSKDESLVEAAFDLSRWQWDYMNSGFTMTFNITPSLSIGVGIRGVASISVKGEITLTLFFGVMSSQAEKGHEDLPIPHFTAGWGAKITLVLHMFLFTKTFMIKNFKFENFYDNWEGKDKGVKSQSDEAKSLLQSYTMEELLGEMSILTNDMLADTAEFRSTGLSSASLVAASDGSLAFDWNAHSSEVVLPMEDGTPVTYDVYSFGDVAAEDVDAAEDAAEAAEDANEEGVAAQQDPSATAGDAADAEPVIEDVPQEAAPEATPLDTVVIEPADSALPDAAVATDATAGEATGALVAEGEDVAAVAAAAIPLTSARLAVTDTEDAMLALDDDVAVPDAIESVPEVIEPATDGAEPVMDAATSPAGDASQTGDDDVADEAIQGQDESSDNDTGLSAMFDPYTFEILNQLATLDLPEPNVGSLGERGGIRPSSDAILFENVFGDPRAKIIDVSCDYENPNTKTSSHLHAVLCLRIGTVDIGGGQMRTRVIMTAIGGDLKGATRVVEFAIPNPRNPSPVLHEDLYDYDFDVSATYEDQKRYSTKWAARSNVAFNGTNISIVLVSGKRDNGDDTSLAVASTDLVFTTMRIPAHLFFGYDNNYDSVSTAGNVIRPDLRNFLSMPGKDALGGISAGYHSISNLQITYEPTSYNPKRYPVCCVTFMDRTGATPDETIGINSYPHLGLLFYDWSTMNVYRPQQSSIDLGGVDPSVYEMVLCPKMGDSYTLMLRGSESVYYWLLKLDFNYDKVNGLTRCKSYDPTVRLTPWYGRDCFLTSWTTDESQLALSADERDYSTWTLHKATWSGDATPQLQFEPVGPSSFNIANFSVSPSGNFMYWPQERDESDDRVWTADGTEDVKPRPASYQIVACRLRGERFTDPFVVADLSNDTDVLTVLNTTRGATLEMLRTEFVPTTNDDGTPRFTDSAGNPLYNASNIWYTSVPDVLCATAIASEALNPLVKPGAPATFHVAIRNDGNCFLSGCSLTLCAYNEATSCYERADGTTVALSFSADTLQESSWNPRDPDGNLTNVEDDYALFPGKTSVYAVKVTIPKDWSGEKKVLFVAHDAVETDELAAQADEGVTKVSYSIEPGEYRVIQNRTAPDSEYVTDKYHMDTLVIEPPETEDVFVAAHMTSTNDNGTPSNSGGKPSTLPQTGDDSPSGVLAAGLGALGAAVLAYERRRAENEE